MQTLEFPTLVMKLNKIQKELKAPKGQYNNFGKYKYRSCEDILEAVKPLLDGVILTVNDDIVLIGDRYYVKATATITDGKNNITNTAFARESLNKKGMDESQITGTASSYARKYALNGLFLIDDTKDADTDEHANQSKGKPAKKKLEKVVPTEEQYMNMKGATKMGEAGILKVENAIANKYILTKEQQAELLAMIESEKEFLKGLDDIE